MEMEYLWCTVEEESWSPKQAPSALPGGLPQEEDPFGGLPPKEPAFTFGHTQLRARHPTLPCTGGTHTERHSCTLSHIPLSLTVPWSIAFYKRFPTSR